MAQDFYDLGAEEATAQPTPQAAQRAHLSAIPAKSNAVGWAIGVALGLFIGLPILLNATTELVRAAKE